jgi:hypothetical protein
VLSRKLSAEAKSSSKFAPMRPPSWEVLNERWVVSRFQLTRYRELEWLMLFYTH